MTAINLPTVNFNINESTSEETMEQILDALIKYRKELNFLLMNLDFQNMPQVGDTVQGINELVGEMDGNFSVIQQTQNGILLATGGDGTLASFQVGIGQIKQQVSDNYGNISDVTQQVGGIQSTVSTNTGNISTVTQKADLLATIVVGTTGDISQVVQTDGGIISTVEIGRASCRERV